MLAPGPQLGSWLWVALYLLPCNPPPPRHPGDSSVFPGSGPSQDEGMCSPGAAPLMSIPARGGPSPPLQPIDQGVLRVTH